MNKRVFTGHLGSWPEVYETTDGTFVIRVPHFGPHATLGGMCVLVCWAFLGWGVYFTWHINILDGIGAAVLALLAGGLLATLISTRMWLAVYLDGSVLRAYERFRRRGRWQPMFNFEEPYRLQAQEHSEVLAQDRRNAQTQGQQPVWSPDANKEENGPSSGPNTGFNVFAGSSELFVVRGSGEWIRLAALSDDAQARKAAQLVGALEFVFYRARQNAAMRARPSTAVTPGEHGQLSSPAENAVEEYE